MSSKYIGLRTIFTTFLSILIIAGAAAVVSAQSDLRWVRGGSYVPSNAVEGGEDSNGDTLYICRTSHSGTTVPGKVVGGKCNYNWGTTEYASGTYDILVGTGEYWTRDLNTRTALAAAVGTGQDFYICSAHTQNGSHPGRLQNGKCNYSYGGRGYSTTDFEVLNGRASGNDSAVTISLLDAASRGDAANVRAALKSGQAINQRNTKGQTALMLGASKAAPEVVRVLLYEGATVDARDNDGFTALALAAFAGDANSVRQLLRAGANASSKSNSGYTPLYWAAASGDIDTARAIIAELGNQERNTDFPVHGAAAYDRTEMIDYLINTEEYDVDDQDQYGQTALVVAARGDKAAAVTALIRAGADVTIRTSNNSEVFGLAAVSNSAAALGALLNSGKFPVKSPLVEAGLRTAAKNSKLQALNLLIQRGVNPNSPNNEGNTALMLAAIEGHDDVAKALLAARVNIDAKNPRGETALILAASNGKRDVVKALIKAGADVRATDNNGKTAAQYAAQNGHNDTRKDLEKAGGN